MSNLFMRAPAAPSATDNRQFDSRGQFCLSRETLRAKPVTGIPAFYAEYLSLPAVQSTIACFLVILVSMMAMVNPVYASDTVAAINTTYNIYGSGFYMPSNATSPAEACTRMAGETAFLAEHHDLGRWHCIYIYPNGQEWRGGVEISITCPANSKGVTSCICADKYVPDSIGKSCVLSACPANMSGAGCIQEHYILSALQDPIPDVEPGSSASPYVEVLNALTRQPKEGAVVNIKVDVDDSSGGHKHGSTGGAQRPKGTLGGCKAGGVPGTVDCTTGPNGRVSFTFGAPAASGTHTFTAVCISNACSGSKTGKIDVKVDGLEPIPSSPLYTFIGDNNKHAANHYLTPAAATVLRDMAASYYIEDKFWQLKQARRGKKGQYTYTASKLHVNDASLKWGGKFDIHGRWVGDHQGHKRGIVVDIRANQININNGAIPPQSFVKFQEMALGYSADSKIHCSDDSRLPPTCIGSDGSQDDLRHFHVILIGGIDK